MSPDRDRETDRTYLLRALALAAAGAARGEGGPFGALVVQVGAAERESPGEVVGEGCNQVVACNDPTAHAEIVAIRDACRRLGRFHLEDCVLYASSEPCPMCLAAACWARVQRIVYANPRAVAAAVGFCDDDLYCELSLPPAERRVPLEHLALPGADAPLRAWFADPARVRY